MVTTITIIALSVFFKEVFLKKCKYDINKYFWNSTHREMQTWDAHMQFLFSPSQSW